MTLIIKDVLERHGINIAKLMTLMEKKGHSLSRVAISNLISGKSSPKVSTLEEIAEATGIDVRDFFATETEQKPIYERNEDGTYKQVGFLNK